MSEALPYLPPPLKRADRFLFSFRYQLLGDEALLAITDPSLTVIGELDQQSFIDFYNYCLINNLLLPEFTVLGDETLSAITDSDLEVIAEAIAATPVTIDNVFTGNVRWRRDSGFYEVEFDVDNSRIYLLHSSVTLKIEDRVPSYIVTGNH